MDYDAIDQAASIYDLMEAVTVVESMYSVRVNYVHIRNMIQGLGHRNERGKPLSWHLDKDSELRKWFIERLIK